MHIVSWQKRNNAGCADTQHNDTHKHLHTRHTQDPSCATHWLSRPAFVGLLATALQAAPHAANVRIVTSAAVTGVRRAAAGGSGAGGRVQVDIEGADGAVTTYAPSLLLGCDGVGSAVRCALQRWAEADPSLRAAAGSFAPVSLECPSAGLRFKVLPLPPCPTLRDGTEMANTRCVAYWIIIYLLFTHLAMQRRRSVSWFQLCSWWAKFCAALHCLRPKLLRHTPHTALCCYVCLTTPPHHT